MRSNRFKIPLARGRKGAALAEYAILVGLVGVVALPAVGLLGTQVEGSYDTATRGLGEAIETADTSTGGSGSGDIFDPVPSDSSGCQAIPDDQGYHYSDDWPDAPCFTHTQIDGDTIFDFDSGDTRPVFVSGTPTNGNTPAWLEGYTGNNTFIIDSYPTKAYFFGGAHYDRLIIRGYRSDEVDIGIDGGYVIIQSQDAGADPQMLYADIDECDMEELVFDDRTLTMADYETQGGFSCMDEFFVSPDSPDDGSSEPSDPSEPDGPSDPDGPGGDPFFPPPGGGGSYSGDPSNTPYTSVSDSCIGDADWDRIWCFGDSEMPPFLELRENVSTGDPFYHGKSCAYDTSQNAFITEGGSMTCDVSEYYYTSDATCYVNHDFMPMMRRNYDDDCWKVEEENGTLMYSTPTISTIRVSSSGEEVQPLP